MMRRDDDQALVTVVGFVLVFALFIGAYAATMREQIPSTGASAERAWIADVESAFRAASSSMTQGTNQGAPVVVVAPPPPHPEVPNIPFVKPVFPAPATGTVSFAPQCGTVRATHVDSNGTLVTDLAHGGGGCLVFDPQSVYTPHVSYVLEFGGVIRVQPDGDIVIAGPALDLTIASPSDYHAIMALPLLRGTAQSSSVDGSGVRVNILPGPSATEVEQNANAQSATWTLHTTHLLAWDTWFQSRFRVAGWTQGSDYQLVCAPADCSSSPLSAGDLTIQILGPRSNSTDIKLAISYSAFDVDLT